MKWVIFGLAVACVPALTFWLRHYPSRHPLFWTVIGSLPFLLSALPKSEIALMNWELWPGMTRGLIVSLFDLIAVAVYFALPRRAPPTPFRLGMGLYLAAILCSVFVAQVPMAALFYLWQLVRIFFFCSVVAKACALDDRIVPALVRGLALGLCIQGFVVVFDIFASGALQARGLFVHQNSLGLMSHFAVFPAFALLLAGQRGILPVSTTLAGVVIAVSTASRATIGFAALGLVALFTITALSKWTRRKAGVAIVGVIAMSVFALAATASLERRFAKAPLDAAYDERALLISVSAAMLADNPLGVGSNNFTTVANTRGYVQRAGIAWTSSSAIVHNIYWLTLAEAGHFGLAALLILLAGPLIVALRAGWRYRRDARGELLLGLAMSLLVVYGHSYYEWVFMTGGLQYAFALNVGMIAGLARQLGYWGHSAGVASSPLGEMVGTPRPAKLFSSGMRGAAPR